MLMLVLDDYFHFVFFFAEKKNECSAVFQVVQS